MEWWVIAISLVLCLATWAFYCLVVHLRNTP